MQERLPSMFQEKGWVEAGGLMYYGEDFAYMHRRAAYFVDRILEQATKFEMALNLKAAKAIGLPIPDSILALADKVIE